MSLDDNLDREVLDRASELYYKNRGFYKPNRFLGVGEYLKGLGYALIPLSGVKKMNDFQGIQSVVEADFMVDIARNQYSLNPIDRLARVGKQSRNLASFMQARHSFQSGFRHGVIASVFVLGLGVLYGDQESNGLLNQVLPLMGVTLAGLLVGDAVYHVCRRYRIIFERMK